MRSNSRIHATYLQLIARDWRKYLGFIAGLRALGLLSARGRFLELYYVFMRHADDVADRDVAPPGGGDPVAYLERMRDFVRAPRAPRDDVEALYVQALRYAAELGFDVTQESEALLSSLLFDAQRYGSCELFPRETLDRYYFDRDFLGTSRTLLKAFGDDPDRFELLRPLCTATRLHYDMADFAIDVSKGFVNIAIEDAQRLGIERADLSPHNPKVERLFAEQAARGLALLREHAASQHAFNPLSRAVFLPFYVLPCQAAFRKRA